MDDKTRIEIEAAAFRALRHHLMERRADVQNIDLMNLAGFCRNCLARWYQEAANERGIAMTKDEARAFLGRTEKVLEIVQSEMEAVPRTLAEYGQALNASSAESSAEMVERGTPC